MTIKYKGKSFAVLDSNGRQIYVGPLKRAKVWAKVYAARGAYVAEVE